jgi:putative iron-dependent peroxidase
VGVPTLQALGQKVPALRTFPTLNGPGGVIPSTQRGLWVFLRGQDPGILFDLTERVKNLLEEGFRLDDAMETFTYAGGRDLTGYEDGTENPKESAAIQTAIVGDSGPWKGSSFVAVQRWKHNLERFRSFSIDGQNAMIGRRRDTNDEIADAPLSAHVKRAAQESFTPAAFMVRRSMPWATAHEQGLEFIAYGDSLDPYERVLRRMVGLEDGVVDALFTFSQPMTGGYYWCPPTSGKKIHLDAIGVN